MVIEELNSNIQGDFADLIVSAVVSAQKEVIVHVKGDAYLQLLKNLKDDHKYSFDHLSCLTAVDYPKENKMTIVDHLWSYPHCHQLTVKLDVPRDNPKAPSVEAIWKSANWFEREVFDLYGVVFEGHSDLRRIMMPDDYLKYPLRKDFTDDGFIVKPN